jgi:hypothetical protein
MGSIALTYVSQHKSGQHGLCLLISHAGYNDFFWFTDTSDWATNGRATDCRVVGIWATAAAIR